MDIRSETKLVWHRKRVVISGSGRIVDYQPKLARIADSAQHYARASLAGSLHTAPVSRLGALNKAYRPVEIVID
jgi:hypothetical protein